MAITHLTAVRTAAAVVIAADVDVGSANPTGRLNFLTAADAALGSCNFSNPAFPTPTTPVATASAISNGTLTGAGTAAKFTVTNRDGTVVFSGSVGATGSGADITFPNVDNWKVGDVVVVSSFTYTAMP